MCVTQQPAAGLSNRADASSTPHTNTNQIMEHKKGFAKLLFREIGHWVIALALYTASQHADTTLLL